MYIPMKKRPCSSPPRPVSHVAWYRPDIVDTAVAAGDFKTLAAALKRPAWSTR